MFDSLKNWWKNRKQKNEVKKPSTSTGSRYPSSVVTQYPDPALGLIHPFGAYNSQPTFFSSDRQFNSVSPNGDFVEVPKETTREVLPDPTPAADPSPSYSSSYSSPSSDYSGGSSYSSSSYDSGSSSCDSGSFSCGGGD